MSHVGSRVRRPRPRDSSIIVTNASTVQTYTGQRPGHNLFGGSVIALDVRTGERRWHFQIHHSDQWNYDLPTPPMLMDLTVDGEVIPALVQNTKQGLVFAFNRETGEPLWPIEERPVFQTEVPGNYTAATQPYPTLPEPLDDILLNGLTEEFVIDYTPDLRAQAQIILSQFRVGGLYVPPLPYNHENEFRNNVGCQGPGTSSLTPRSRIPLRARYTQTTTGTVAPRRSCSPRMGRPRISQTMLRPVPATPPPPLLRRRARQWRIGYQAAGPRRGASRFRGSTACVSGSRWTTSSPPWI